MSVRVVTYTVNPSLRWVFTSRHRKQNACLGGRLTCLQNSLLVGQVEQKVVQENVPDSRRLVTPRASFEGISVRESRKLNAV